MTKRPPPATSTAETLKAQGLLAKREPPTVEWKDRLEWGRGRTVDGRHERLLTNLVIDASLDLGVGYTVSMEDLRQTVGKSNPISIKTLEPYVVALRNELSGGVKTVGEGSPIQRQLVQGQDKLALNGRLVRCDWFEVLGAEHTAKITKDPYEKAYALSMAERAYVESLRATPDDVLAEARRDPPSHLECVVRKRWELRKRYLQALIKIGHTDTAVNEYRLWSRLALEASGSLGPQLPGRCSDEFFEVNVTFRDRRGRQVPVLELLGALRVTEGSKATTLKAIADRERVPTLLPTPHERGVVRKIDEDFEKEKAKARRYGASTPTNRVERPRTPVKWHQVEALLAHVVKDFPAGFSPQVIIPLGRGGSVVAAALSEMVGCRTVGLISIDQHNHLGSPGTGIPYIRGADLPNKRGCDVLICEDIVTSGGNIEKAIKEVVQPHYPAADIVVATLILNKRARDRFARRPLRWAVGLDVDVAKEEEFWVDFCWRMQHRVHPEKTKRPRGRKSSPAA